MTLAAVLAALVDYVLKAEAVAYFGKGEPLLRFFGLFYAVTGLVAFFLQATAGRFLLSRLGLEGAVASHAAAVGTASLLGLLVPGPWRGIVPRGLDVAVRGSIFRAGYELFYTPLPAATKRSAKSIIDVVADSVGKSAGAAVILIVTASRSAVRVGCRERGHRVRGRDGVSRRPPAQIRLRERARGRTEAPE